MKKFGDIRSKDELEDPRQSRQLPPISRQTDTPVDVSALRQMQRPVVVKKVDKPT